MSSGWLCSGNVIEQRSLREPFRRTMSTFLGLVRDHDNSMACLSALLHLLAVRAL